LVARGWINDYLRSISSLAAALARLLPLLSPVHFCERSGPAGHTGDGAAWSRAEPASETYSNDSIASRNSDSGCKQLRERGRGAIINCSRRVGNRNPHFFRSSRSETWRVNKGNAQKAAQFATTVLATPPRPSNPSCCMMPLCLLRNTRIHVIDQTAAHDTRKFPVFSAPPLPVPTCSRLRKCRGESEDKVKEKWVAPLVYMYCRSEQKKRKGNTVEGMAGKSSQSQH